MRLKNIQVVQQGPLKKNFQLRPSGMNLIYGPNESGKTYILEALINWLFGKKSSFQKKNRSWQPSPSGLVSLTGLPGDLLSEHTFGHDSKTNLTELLSEISEVPSNFEELLVVRAGETLLSSPEALIKDKLSGFGMLDNVLSKIPPTVQRAEITESNVNGNNQGRIKTFRDAKDKLDKLNVTRDEYVEDQGIILDGSRAKLTNLEEQKNKMERARRHRAALTAHQIDSLERDIQKNKPNDLENLQRSFHELNHQLKDSLHIKGERIKSCESRLQHEPWLNKTAMEYRELISRESDSKGGKFHWLKFIGPIVAATIAILGFFGLGEEMYQNYPWVSGGVIVLAIVGVVFYSWKNRNSSKEEVKNPRILYLENEFKRIFDEPLISLETLNQKLFDIAALKGELRELRSTFQADFKRQQEIQELLQTKMPSLLPNVDEIHWEKKLAELVNEVKINKEKVANLKGELNGLGVAESDYLQEGQGVEWNVQEYNRICSDLEKAKNEFRNADNLQGELKSRIARQVGLVSMDWEELVGGLESAIEEAACSYKEVAAEILSQICVTQAVHNQREKRDQHISKRLKEKDLIEELQRIAKGRFSGFSWENGKLSVTHGDHRSDAIEQLSTGAKEQVMIALRSLFARIYLAEIPAFLLLDDAFQHTDYGRREDLVDHALRLVSERGWQVFYFTMDNHLRDLFKERGGSQLGEDFQYVELQ